MRRIGFVTILLIVPFLLTGCGLKLKSSGKTTGQISPLPSGQTITPVANLSAGATYLTVDPLTMSAAIKANYDLVQQKVKTWRDDAILYHFSAKLPGSLALGQTIEVYTYGSPKDAYNWWTLNISQKTSKSVRAVIPKEDYLGTTLQPIPLKFWQTNYVEALQLAEVNGGTDFRTGHPDSQISVNLVVTSPKNFLWWSVEYESPTTEPLKILVNPSTKEVVDEAGKALAKGAANPTASPLPSPHSSLKE